MKSQPRVTLITPTFNQADYVAEAIETVLAQSHADIEYIVIDDGSTDRTLEVLHRFDERLHWLTQPNAGQAHTLNRGWSLAQGEILGYLSSDDRLRPGAVAAAVAALDANPEAVACYCDFDLIDERGNRVRTVHTEDFSPSRLVRDLVCLPGPGAFFRRSAFEAAGGWNPQLRQTPDFDFWMRLSRQGSFIRIPSVYADYRIHPESASYKTTTPERADEIIHVVDGYWRGAVAVNHTDVRASRSMSRLISARAHFSSGRLLIGMRRVLQAAKLAPARAFELVSWRIVVGGLLRRAYYSLRVRLKKSQ